MTQNPMLSPLLAEILSAFGDGGAPAEPGLALLSETGDADLPSWFAVTDLAAASIGAAGLMAAKLMQCRTGALPHVTVDRRLASFWFAWSLRPEGWQVPPPWDPIAGDYRAKDGWIRLHTNAPHHRAAAQSILGAHADREAMQRAVERWDGDALESAVVEAGGCAAVMHSFQEWEAGPQGAAVAREPLVIWREHGRRDPPWLQAKDGQPLAGIRVLDLTRVLAGPVAGRFLAAYGADVLRIDPPDWDEPGVVPEVALGKRCAGLNLKDREDRAVFERLLAGADILLHGYRAGALAGLGFDGEGLRAINPRLIDVGLDAYGWSGPWSMRRGFDSLVQMSAGIAEYGMRLSGAQRPVPLPVQALDHATGYLMAASVCHALRRFLQSGDVMSARLSLARTARLLAGTRRTELGGGMMAESGEDLDPAVEKTAWGSARRIRFPLRLDGVPAAWRIPAGPLRAAPAEWEAG